MKATATLSEHDRLSDSTDLGKRLGATLIGRAALLEWLGISDFKLTDLTKNHSFPQPIRLSRRNYRYMVADVQSWLNTTGRTLRGAQR
jgi:predicted DNA-binding transcriptional regulator AlpA